MTVIVARTSTPEGEAALTASIEEARRRQEDLVVFNLEGTQLDPEGAELKGVPVTYRMPDARNHDAVGDLLDAAEEIDATAVVIGVKHRSPVGKFLLGSSAQQILLEANAPVIAVKSRRSRERRKRGPALSVGLFRRRSP
ncbi:universal stress protein [Arthrobacter sp. ATA002]|uniref:universal stress protein n=1 Tax=Arthrobacter sp. ATA002 TaxID=2991715 RepID=UPI002E346E8C|nr:universal stress protein [Arthrobacter sp. ATA002]